MDIKDIQNLIKFVSKSGVNEVSLEKEDFKITIKTDHSSGAEQIVVQQAAPVVHAAPVVQQPAAVAAPPAAQEAAPAAQPAAEENSNHITIKSPMIGTFYRRPAPDKDPFINVGDSVAQGDVICIIEAMKLFNEIEAEVSGKVVKVLVEENTPVEYDQPLFIIDPS
ncbi:MAG: acetyl-CoA carboxylase biotin carboxyl carrier protein [Crocinitomicaceae bacterium]|nr:acetyl-CoA carboxylase biotin carboxyl carrier protein [Crocinitomicaceae bacterium]